MILVPTRELALQTSQVCKELGKHVGVAVMVTTGGTSLKDDIMRLHQPVHIVVATPGRLVDLASKGVAKLGKATMLAMDEADKLLSPEFQPVISQVINFMAKNRQILLYSATFPVTVKDFKDKYLRKTVCHQPHGGAHAQGYHPVLRLCRREAKGSLLEHALQQASNQSIDHFLQQRDSCRVAR